MSCPYSIKSTAHSFMNSSFYDHHILFFLLVLLLLSRKHFLLFLHLLLLVFLNVFTGLLIHIEQTEKWHTSPTLLRDYYLGSLSFKTQFLTLFFSPTQLFFKKIKSGPKKIKFLSKD